MQVNHSEKVNTCLPHLGNDSPAAGHNVVLLHALFADHWCRNFPEIGHFHVIKVNPFNVNYHMALCRSLLMRLLKTGKRRLLLPTTTSQSLVHELLPNMTPVNL